MLFSRSTYAERRSRLRQLVGSGIIFIPGNNDSPCNFPNTPTSSVRIVRFSISPVSIAMGWRW